MSGQIRNKMRKHFPIPSCLRPFRYDYTFLIFIASFIGNLSYLQAQFNTVADGRIESEFKLSVPKEIEAKVWEFLTEEFDDLGIKKIDTSFTATMAQEIFYDQYFDDENKTLFQAKAGVRFRQRFVADTLSKQLLQLKLPLNDTTGVARQEIKFNVYTKIKKSDRQAMHPFWRYVRPKNREEVNLHIANHDLTGNDLRPAVKVRQDRKRIYVSEKGIPFLTMTFDEVCSFYFPYPCYTELELELNEIRFTDGDAEERDRMERINQTVKDKILNQFSALKQDQTPKYNKMVLLLENNFLEKIYDNLMYLILGCIMLFAIVLFIKNQTVVLHANTKSI